MSERLFPLRSPPQLAGRRADACAPEPAAAVAPAGDVRAAVTARVAGVRDVWVASPKPQALSLAAAAIAGADGVLAAGGAQAIAALAYGAGPIAPRDVIVGPGNRYVTVAKQLVSSAVAIDLLAGPPPPATPAGAPARPGRGA